jgi:hypothetical protein
VWWLQTVYVVGALGLLIWLLSRVNAKAARQPRYGGGGGVGLAVAGILAVFALGLFAFVI